MNAVDVERVKLKWNSVECLRDDIMCQSQVKMKGKGEAEFGKVSERSSMERGRAGGLALVSPEVYQIVLEQDEILERLKQLKLGREPWAFVTAYGPNSKKDERKKKTWGAVEECLQI